MHMGLIPPWCFGQCPWKPRPQSPTQRREVSNARTEASMAYRRTVRQRRRRNALADLDHESGVCVRGAPPAGPGHRFGDRRPDCRSLDPVMCRPLLRPLPGKWPRRRGLPTYPDITGFFGNTSNDPTSSGFFGQGLPTPEQLYPLFSAGVHQEYLNYPQDANGLPDGSTSVGQGASFLQNTILSDQLHRLGLNRVRLLAEFHASRRHHAAARPERRR